MGYFAGKRILITGAGSGLGRRMALGMAREGGRIIAWDIQAQALAAVQAELKLASGMDHLGMLCDVSENAAVAEYAADVKKAVGTPDIVINNAGLVTGKHFLDCREEEILRTMGVNTMALFWTAKAFLPDMISRNSGHFVTVASAAGLVGTARLADYCASKHAAVGFDESIRAELNQTAPGVHTTIISPYYINTGMFRGVKTRFPWLLPIMDERYAADRMTDAIRRRKKRLIMPPLVYTVPLLRLFPVPVFDWVVNFLGVNASMHGFTGRKEGAHDPS